MNIEKSDPGAYYLIAAQEDELVQVTSPASHGSQLQG
jgi:hypothetical protein